MRRVNQVAFLGSPMHTFRAFVSSEVVTVRQNVEAHIGAIARPFAGDLRGFGGAIGGARNDTRPISLRRMYKACGKHVGDTYGRFLPKAARGGTDRSDCAPYSQETCVPLGARVGRTCMARTADVRGRGHTQRHTPDFLRGARTRLGGCTLGTRAVAFARARGGTYIGNCAPHSRRRARL